MSDPMFSPSQCRRFLSRVARSLAWIFVLGSIALGTPSPTVAESPSKPETAAGQGFTPSAADEAVRARFERELQADRRVTCLGCAEELAASGGLAGALDELLELSELGDARTSEGRPVLLAARAVEGLAGDEVSALQAAYAGGAPVLLLEPSREEIRALHELLGTGLAVALPEGHDRVEAYGVRGESESDAGSSFTLYPRDPGPEAPLEALAETFPEASLLDRPGGPELGASAVVNWLLFSEDLSAAGVSAEGGEARTGAEPSDPPADLTRLTKAWTDVAVWSDGVTTFQMTFYAWPAHSKVQGRDYFYLQGQGIFNPTGNYRVQSGYRDGHQIKWYDNDVYCVGDYPRACFHQGYITRYSLNAQPRGLGGNRHLARLIESSPKTSQGQSSWTTGVSWSLGGAVTAGYGTGTVEVSGGVTVSNQRTVTVPDVRVENRSLRTANNAAADYMMPLLQVIAGDRCYNRLEAPRAVQIRTFQPRTDTVWSTAPELRSHQESLVVDVELEVRLAYTILKAWPATGSAGGYCNLFTCDCKASSSTSDWILRPHALSIPFPGKK